MDWPGVPRIVLTPNIMEFKRLCDAMVCKAILDLTQKIDTKGDPRTLCPQLARALQNVTITQKGEHDTISNGLEIPSELGVSGEVLENEVQGGLKRVGGQGDILSGSTGVLMAWGSEWVKGTYS